MATKKTEPAAAPAAAQESTALDALCAKYKTPPAVFAGVCAAQGWRAGKQLTEPEYTAAVAAFTGAPMDGHAPDKRTKSGVKR